VAVEVLAGRHPGAVEPDQRRREGRRRGEGGHEVPVAGGHERHALALALHDQADGGALHPPGRQARGDLAPQDLGHRVAVEPVDDAPRLLGVDQPGVDVPRLGDGLVDGLAGDLVEHHPPHRHGRIEHLDQVPGDGLALAVLVGGEIEAVGLLEGGLEPPDHLALGGRHHVGGAEPVIDVDGQALGLEVADGADRGLDDEVAAQEPGDGARLGGRLDDHERRGHRRQFDGRRAAAVKHLVFRTGGGRRHRTDRAEADPRGGGSGLALAPSGRQRR
jgi:hypothetical protein